MIPTVKVLRGGRKGFRIINLSDFDPSKHILADAPKADAKPTIHKKGKKHGNE